MWFQFVGVERKSFDLPTVAFFIILTGQMASADSVVVYDTELDNLIGGQGYLESKELGQTITLGGVERTVTSFDIALGSNDTTPYQLKFYQLDGPNGIPDTLIWESPVQVYPWVSPFYNRKIISIDVPEVAVPDTFAWTISLVEPRSLQVIAGDRVIVGDSGFAWQRLLNDEMRVNQSQFLFAPTIRATIPEPDSLPLAIMAIVLLLLRRVHSTHIYTAH